MAEKPNVLYTARATAYGDGRNGSVTSDDDIIDFDLAVPKELGGPGGEKSNPEQLFAAGYAACFHSAIKLVARRDKLDTEGSTVSAAVGIGVIGEGPALGITAALDISLPNLDRDSAEKLIEAAHQVCPYSNATRGNIVVELNIV
jgi:lipoyl-dependent peroxiredoxin